MTKELEFSIILLVCHGGSFLRNALASLREINYPPNRFEVLIAGDADDQESRKITDIQSNIAECDIWYIGHINSKRSARLNAACAVARGRILAFADDDCTFFPDWLQRLNEVFQRAPESGIVGGPDELGHNASSFSLALDYVLNSLLGTGGLRQGRGLSVGQYYPRLWNMAVPREIVLQVAFKPKEELPQVFAESLMVHEDVELANRIKQSGKSIVFSPQLRVRHCRDTTFRSFVRRNFNMARTCRSLGVHRLPHVMLAVFVLSALVLAMFAISFYPARVAILTVTGIYMGLLLAGAVVGFKRTRRLPVLLIIPLLLVSLHVARGLGYLFPWRDKSGMGVYL